jgi:U3 small nucleolar RNA-associated protein 7
VQVWKDALSTKAMAPYMNHSFHAGTLADLAFCPYEDVLGAGHSGGVSTILVPGAGEPNFDSLVANPYQTKKERREAEVAKLLDKLQPEMIVIDPDTVGQIRKAPLDVQKERQTKAMEARMALKSQREEKQDKKTRMKGKLKPSRKYRKKQQNVIDEKKMKHEERKQEIAARRKRDKEAKDSNEAPAAVPSILKSFYRKKY